MMHHHQLIRALIAEVREMRLENAAIEERAVHYELLADRRRRSLQQVEREAEAERFQANSRELNRTEAVRKLERARSCGDHWAELRALKELRES